MGHHASRKRQLLLVIGLTACFATLSCDRSGGAAARRAAGGRRTIASLVPAATDMLLGMGAGDHLVAVSNYESAPEVKNLPRVGDYQTTDWETLARLHPDVMVIQIAPERLPPGLKQRADELGIELVNVKIERLEDVFDNVQRLGAVAGEVEKGRAAARTLRERFDAIRDACAARPSVSALIVRDENGREVIGPDTFLDDLLKIVNATNAAASLGTRYPSIDRERLLALQPEAVIVVLPGAKPQALDAAARFWASIPELPAVKSGRVRTIADDYALVPGPRLADLAQKFADCLDPASPTATATTRPATSRTTAPAH
jgi:ABC-type Fe3+-hydroxamate transport system substrate-binding protein